MAILFTVIIAMIIIIKAITIIINSCNADTTTNDSAYNNNNNSVNNNVMIIMITKMAILRMTMVMILIMTKTYLPISIQNSYNDCDIFKSKILKKKKIEFCCSCITSKSDEVARRNAGSGRGRNLAVAGGRSTADAASY